jgi:hypothetical protein
MRHPPTQRIVHRLAAAITTAVLALGMFLAVTPTAASANTGMIAGSCYAGAFSADTRFINYGTGGNPVSYYTLTFRTPTYYSCHDINVSAVTANGHTVATMLRVHEGYFDSAYSYQWHWVSSAWVVLASNYCRGCLYTIEAWKVSSDFGPVIMKVAA